jgi:hypothetical protein
MGGVRGGVKEALADLIQSSTYQQAPDGVSTEAGTRLHMLQGVVSRYRTAAKQQLLREYPEEVGGPVGQRSREVREAWRQAQSQSTLSDEALGQVQALLSSYGIR